MSAKKTLTNTVDIDDLFDQIDALQAKNAALKLEIGDLQEQAKNLVSANVQMEDRYNEERKYRLEYQKSKNELEEKVAYLTTQLETAKELRAVEKSKRHGSIPKFVIASAVALVALVIPYTLQEMAAIGPQLAFTIECGLMMVIAWCYAIIWDRSRK